MPARLPAIAGLEGHSGGLGSWRSAEDQVPARPGVDCLGWTLRTAVILTLREVSYGSIAIDLR